MTGARPGTNGNIDIVEYSEAYGNAFERLNREWLEAWFRVEGVDEGVLSDPRSNIIDRGGVVLYACLAGEAIGTVALKACGNGVFELTKMAVTRRYQGRGIGRLLLSGALDRYRSMGGKKLYLESNSSLAAALALYESAGFHHETPPAPSDYDRADVYMVYRGG